jgi:large repetitive protein
LLGHASCALLVAFVPKSVGAGTGTLTVTDEFRTQTVTLNGVGVAPAGVSLSPVGTVGFAATGVGLSAAAQTVTLTNNGGLALSIASLTVSGDFVIVSGTNTCGSALAAGSACTLEVTFSPAGAGALTGSLTVMDNAAGSPQSLRLTGTGVDFALSANGSTTATIAAGAQAVFPMLLTSAAGVPGTVVFTCAPVPAYATCVVTPATAALGGTTPVTVTIATSVAGAAAELRGLPGAGVWVVGLLPLVWVRRRRAVVMLCGALLLAGCMTPRYIPESTVGGGAGANPTPSGTYNVVVSGTSAGLVRSVGLTVVVE